MAVHIMELSGFQMINYHLFSLKEFKASAQLVWKGQKVADLIYAIEEGNQPQVELDPSGWGQAELEKAVDEILAIIPLMEKKGSDSRRCAEIMGSFLMLLRTMNSHIQDYRRHNSNPGLRYLGIYVGQRTLRDTIEPDEIRVDYLGKDESIAEINNMFDLSLVQMINFGGLGRCLAVYLTEADCDFPTRWRAQTFANLFLHGQGINEMAAEMKARSSAPAVRLCELGLAHLEKADQHIDAVLSWKGKPVASAYGLYSKESIHMQVLDSDLHIPAHLVSAYGELLREGYNIPFEEVNATQIAVVFLEALIGLGMMEKAYYQAKLSDPKADYILLYADQLDTNQPDCVLTAVFEAQSADLAETTAREYVQKRIQSGEIGKCTAFLLLSGDRTFPKEFTASEYMEIFRRAANMFGDTASR